MMTKHTPNNSYSSSVLIDVFIILSIELFIALFFDYKLLIFDTILTGGDTASWYGIASHLQNTLLPNGRLTGWDMGNFCGYPNFSFYFIPPFLLSVLLSYLGMPLTISLKIVVMSGLFALPIVTYLCLRCLKYRFPMPIIGALTSLIFIFNETYTMFGGNALSTFAGEFCYMFSFSLFILFIGTFYKGFYSEKYAIQNGVLLGLIGLSHLFMFIPSIFLILYYFFSTGKLRYIIKVSWTGFGLMAFWILPILVYRSDYTVQIGMIWNDFTFLSYILAGFLGILICIGPPLCLIYLHCNNAQIDLDHPYYHTIQFYKKISLYSLIIISGVICFTGIVLCLNYLSLGKGMWSVGIDLPDFSKGFLSTATAMHLQKRILPIGFIIALFVIAVGIWMNQNKQFHYYCKVIGAICVLIIVSFIVTILYIAIIPSIESQYVKDIFTQLSIQILLFGVFIQLVIWGIFYYKPSQNMIHQIIQSSYTWPHLSMWISIIIGCLVMYFSSCFLDIPDIRFLPLLIFVVLIIFFVETMGLWLSYSTGKTKFFGIIAFALLIMIWILFNSKLSDAWYRYNNQGYESTAGYDQFMQINTFLKQQSKGDPLNAPRVAYEKTSLYGRFGGDRAFESLPVFSGRSTLEGIHYASSIASKCITFLQTQFSQEIKAPMPFIASKMDASNLPYYFDLYNISQLILMSDKAKKSIETSPFFIKEKAVGAISIYKYKNNINRYVDVPYIRPVLYRSKTWATDFYRDWFRYADHIDVLFVPESYVTHPEDKKEFKRSTDRLVELKRFRDDTLNREDLKIQTHITNLSIEFTTNKVGVPHLIKVSYYPNWKVEGAHAVYPVSPHLMLVIPREKTVRLTYGFNVFEKIGFLTSILVLMSLINFRYSFYQRLRRYLARQLFRLESRIITYKVYIITVVLIASLIISLLGIVKRQYPERTYYRGYQIYQNVIQDDSLSTQSKVWYLLRAIHIMAPLLEQSKQYDHQDVIHCMIITALCYEQLGKRDMADTWYKRIISEYPFCLYIAEAYVRKARNHKYERNQLLEQGLLDIQNDDYGKGINLIHSAIYMTQKNVNLYKQALHKEPYSKWINYAREDLRKDWRYFEKLKEKLAKLPIDPVIQGFINKTIPAIKYLSSHGYDPIN